MPVDVPWVDYLRLTEILEEIAYGHSSDADSAAYTIIDIILDVADSAVLESRAQAEMLDASVMTYVNNEIGLVYDAMDTELDLIYSQLDIWLDEVEEWITLLISDITTSIEENVGLTDESIDDMGTVIGDNIGVGISETGSWIGQAYENVKTAIWDETATLVSNLANLVDMIINAPQIIINKMATELVPAEAGQWLMTAGDILTGIDMGQWLNNFQSVITSAGDKLFEFDTEEIMNNFITAFKLMQAKLPELLR